MIRASMLLTHMCTMSATIQAVANDSIHLLTAATERTGQPTLTLMNVAAR
jgi:hypothetical protein